MIQTVEIPMPLPSCANLREHWSARAKRTAEQRSCTTWQLEARFMRPTLPCTVTLVRVSARPLDDDNLGSCFKAIRDAVAKWIGTNDGPRSGITWRYDQDSGPAKYQAARIIIDGEIAHEGEPVSLSVQRRLAAETAHQCRASEVRQ